MTGRRELRDALELANRGVQTGDAFRQLRKALGLRATDVAQLFGVTPETISHWETGKARPARCAFVVIAAMVQDAMDGLTTTRDRLAAAEGTPHPCAGRVRLREP